VFVSRTQHGCTVAPLQASVQGSFYKVGRFLAVACSKQFGIGCATELDASSGLLKLSADPNAASSDGVVEGEDGEDGGDAKDGDTATVSFTQTVPNSAYTCGMRRGMDSDAWCCMCKQRFFTLFVVVPGHLLTRVDDVRVTTANLNEIQVRSGCTAI